MYCNRFQKQHPSLPMMLFLSYSPQFCKDNTIIPQPYLMIFAIPDRIERPNFSGIFWLA